MSVLATSKFWGAAVERAVKTFAQAAVALLTGNGLDLVSVNWGELAAVAGMAAVVSLLTSVASASVGNDGPSLAGEELVPATPPDQGIGADPAAPAV